MLIAGNRFIFHWKYKCCLRGLPHHPPPPQLQLCLWRNISFCRHILCYYSYILKLNLKHSLQKRRPKTTATAMSPDAGSSITHKTDMRKTTFLESEKMTYRTTYKCQVALKEAAESVEHQHREVFPLVSKLLLSRCLNFVQWIPNPFPTSEWTHRVSLKTTVGFRL